MSLTSQNIEQRGTLAGSLYEQLTCPVCLETFTDPRVFPCQHSYCSKCIELMITTKTSLENTIKCPKCCAEHSIPADGFPKNFMLFSLIDLLNTHSNDAQTTGVTPTTPMSSLTSPITPSIETPTVPMVVLCPSHNTAMECYCTDCKLLICGSCPRSIHRTHTVDKISESLKKSYIDQLRALMIDCEKRIITLDEEIEGLDQKDVAVVSKCKKDIDKYYNEHEEAIIDKIAKLNAKLEAVRLRHETLVKKLDGFSHVQAKKRAIDKDMIDQLRENVSRTVMSAKTLIHSNDATRVVLKYNKVKEEMKRVLDAGVDHASLQPIPKISLSKEKDPLVCELIDPHSVSVQELTRVRPGANSFTMTLTTPLINKPRFKINITLPNGKKAESIKFDPLGENSWLVSFFVPTMSFSLSNLFSSGNDQVEISITLCDVEIGGSPFKVPCDKLVKKELFKELSV